MNSFSPSVCVGLLLLVAGIGHAVLWTALLNHFYGRPWPKSLLRLWRYTTAAIIAAYPAVIGYSLWSESELFQHYQNFRCNTSTGTGLREYLAFGKKAPGAAVAALYAAACLVLGGLVFPWVTWKRVVRRPPPCLQKEQSQHYDFGKQHIQDLVGDGYMRWAARLPGNEIFRLEITEQILRLPHLPPTLHGLHLLVLSDFHFHGTPSRRWFEQVIATVLQGPYPDLVCLLGDYVDRNDHREWIVPLLGPIAARYGKLAILGNHDVSHGPDQIRACLHAAGYQVLLSQWQLISVRGESLAVIGHEGPWLPAPAEQDEPPAHAAFRLGLSHTPDNFSWAIRQQIDLLVCGHVHGGQIRLPVIGPIFVPSLYSRRFDSGVFQAGRTVMTVCRGLSGREPIRFRCRPQILRLILTGENPKDQ
jgi:predicted MPP superfamily phosphohydrolase